MNIEAMQRFFGECKSKFMGIVRKTNFEVEVGDVQNTAYELAVDIQVARGRPFDFDDEDDRSHLLAKLWNRLVKFADHTLRYAVTLDEDPDDERPTQASLIARSITAVATSDPSVLLETEEAEREAEEALLAHYSELVAYLMLFRRFDTRKGLSEFLHIATCTLRYRVARAERRANHRSLFDGIERIEEHFPATIARPATRPVEPWLAGEQWEWSF